jgi:hypothetical protein
MMLSNKTVILWLAAVMVAALCVAPPESSAGDRTPIVYRGELLAPDQVDSFPLELEAGDVVGATVAARDGLDPTVSLIDPDNVTLWFNDNHVYLGTPWANAQASPLPEISSNSTDSLIRYVIDRSGVYFIEVGATGGTLGKYKMDLLVARPGMEAEPVGAKQILFLDFDGATLNASTFDMLGGSGMKTLSPMRDFLTRWGLTLEDEDAVIDAVVAVVEENLSQDIRERGGNGDFSGPDGQPGDFDIEILNSRDDPDEYGINPYVTRVVIGGTTAELGIGTVALAQHCDVGNYQFDDDAVVLLDRLSSEPGPYMATLNQFPIHPRAEKLDLVGVGIGVLAAHEAGHNFGCFHTIINEFPNIMDPRGPGGAANRIGIGPDGKFGSPDDIDVDFGLDVLFGTANCYGITDTLNVVSFGLATGTAVE